jgi:hypothetical protein
MVVLFLGLGKEDHVGDFWIPMHMHAYLIDIAHTLHICINRLHVHVHGDLNFSHGLAWGWARLLG